MYTFGPYVIRLADAELKSILHQVDISFISIRVKLSQFVNIPEPSAVTLSGIVTLGKLLQESKALLPIDVTLLGIVMLLMLLQL